MKEASAIDTVRSTFHELGVEEQESRQLEKMPVSVENCGGQIMISDSRHNPLEGPFSLDRPLRSFQAPLRRPCTRPSADGVEHGVG